MQKAKFYEKNLQWIDAPPDTVFGELLKYACERPPPVARDRLQASMVRR